MKRLIQITAILFSVLILGGSDRGAFGQLLPKPELNKNQRVVKLADLAIMDLWEGDTPTSVYVQVRNIGQADAGSFIVRLSIRKKGSTAKTYVEKRVSGLKAKADLPLFIEIGQPLKDLEIGVYLDARKQIPESDEKNCGKIYPDTSTQGNMTCDDF
jgi:hypothetical protein